MAAERFQTGIAAVSWSLLLNIFLLAIGITWSSFRFENPKLRQGHLPLDPERPPKPRKKIDPKEVIKIVEDFYCDS